MNNAHAVSLKFKTSISPITPEDSMRITGGVFRSRKLIAPSGMSTRPTTDRVREALFSMLTARVPFEGCTVIDLYAGSGALGLEALSRGATKVVFIERDRKAVLAIRENVKALDVESRVTVIASDVSRVLAGVVQQGSVGLVFADPPYADVKDGAFAKASSVALTGAHVAVGATLVLEHSSRDASPDLPGYVLDSTRQYGDTALSFYTRVP